MPSHHWTQAFTFRLLSGGMALACQRPIKREKGQSVIVHRVTYRVTRRRLLRLLRARHAATGGA